MAFKTRFQRKQEELMGLETFEDQQGFAGKRHFKGGGGGTTVQKTELDPVQRRALGSIIAKAEAQYDQPLEFFPGQTLAEQDPLIHFGQTQALRAGTNIDRNNRNLAGALNEALQVDIVNDPRTQALADAVTQPMRDEFTETVLPSISSGAQAAGAFGGSRQGLMEATAGREFGRAIGEARTGIIADAFRAQLQQRLQAAGMFPMLNQQQLLPAQIAQNVGEQRTARSQAEIDADRERFEFEQFEPESRLDRFAARVAGINLGGTTTATSRNSGGGLLGK